MPHVMLRRDWPGNFRRTIKLKSGKSKVLEFSPGVPLDLMPSEIEGIRADLGKALMPVEIDEKKRPRIITDEVDAEDLETVTNAAQPAD